MPHRDLREFDAKQFVARHLHHYLRSNPSPDERFAQIAPDTDLDALLKQEPWLAETSLVVKPDMLFGKRGKLGLVELKVDWDGVCRWVDRHRSPVEIGDRTGTLTHFLVEPFVPHQQEYYLSLSTEREYDRLYFSTEGGVEIEDGWEKKVREFRIPVGQRLDENKLRQEILSSAPEDDRTALAAYLSALHSLFQDSGLAYLEVNPFCLVDGRLVLLDMVARVDDATPAGKKKLWTWSDYPPAFGAQPSPAEDHIRELDAKTGASLKFTLLNPEGRVWLLASGGGASVIYADTVSDLGFGPELANYGEYSGNPSADETWDYAQTVLKLMTDSHHPQGKVLLIGGGIANFSDTAKTFEGIIKALHEYQDKLREGKIRIFVRRGGPNYKRALKMMEECGREIGVPTEVYGPEAHMTEIVHKGVQAL